MSKGYAVGKRLIKVLESISPPVNSFGAELISVVKDSKGDLSEVKVAMFFRNISSGKDRFKLDTKTSKVKEKASVKVNGAILELIEQLLSNIEVDMLLMTPDEWSSIKSLKATEELFVKSEDIKDVDMSEILKYM